MARPIKKGLDYFPLDVYLDNKFQMIEMKYGLTGFGIVIKIFQDIYGHEGYFCYCNEELILNLSFRCKVDEAYIGRLIRDCLRWGLFNWELYDAYNILTSKGIQRRYVDAKRRISSEDLDKRFCLLNTNKDIECSILATKICQNPTNNNQNPTNNNQNPTKEKKRKEKKRNGEETPTLEEVKNFCRENNITTNPEAFYYYYSGRGWQGIVNWKMVLQHWNIKDRGTIAANNNSFCNFTQRNYSDEFTSLLLKKQSQGLSSEEQRRFDELQLQC